MSGSDRQGAYLARGVCSFTVSAAPARLPVPEPCYDNLVTLAIEPGSNGLWRVHESCYRDQMAPLFALRTRKSHGDLRSWPPISRGPGTAKHLRSRLFACDSTDVWPDSHLGFGTFFAFRPRFGVLAFWPGISAAMRARERGLAIRFVDAIFHRALTILAPAGRVCKAFPQTLPFRTHGRGGPKQLLELFIGKSSLATASGGSVVLPIATIF